MHEVELRIPSDHVYEKIARQSALALGQQLSFSEERIADLQLAVSEAVSNAIEHGHELNTDLKVGVFFTISEDGLQVKVVDSGLGFDRTLLSKQPTVENRMEDEVPRGFGIYLIRELVDEMEFVTTPSGTEFTMWFKVTAEENGTHD